jgi:hypothetical protein
VTVELSEWMKVMLGEISRKKEEQEQARGDEQRPSEDKRGGENRRRSEDKPG